MTDTFYSYHNLPDFAVPPGETLIETLESLHMTQADLAKRTGRPLKTINEIIRGVTRILPETALQFEQVLGVPASFWLNLERNYREILARREEKVKLEQQVEASELYPVAQLRTLGFLPDVRKPLEIVHALLSFFGVVDLQIVPGLYEAAQLSFKKSSAHPVNEYATYAWLRQGEIKAKDITCAPYDKAVFMQNLKKIRDVIPDQTTGFIQEMISLCAASGVALVFVPEVKGCRSYGVSRWLTPDKALIMLSLRQKSDDHLWFTFFHEAAHTLFHKKKKIFIDGLDGQVQDENETEANAFSADFMIPRGAMSTLTDKFTILRADIIAFAKAHSITPGIVLGRLQHEGHVPFQTPLNNLKKYYEWT